MKRLPSSFSKLFWDVDFKDLGKEKNKKFIIERILEFGEISDFEELKKIYHLEEIVSVLKESRNLSFKSANFYALILKVNRSEVLCLQKPLMQRQDRF